MKIDLPFVSIQVNNIQYFDLLVEPELLYEVHQAVEGEVTQQAINAIISHVISWRHCGNISAVDFYSSKEDIKQFVQQWIDLLEVYATGGSVLLSPAMLTMLHGGCDVSYVKEATEEMNGPTSAMFCGKLTILEGEQVPVYTVFNPDNTREDIVAIGDVKYEAIFNILEDGKIDLTYFIPPENLDKIASVTIV